MIAHWSDALREMGACSDGLAWARTFSSPEEGWAACEEPEWMFWAACNLEVSRQVVVLAACACARLALKYVPAGEDRRARLALETAERWARGKATLEEVEIAGDGAAYFFSASTSYGVRAAVYAADAASTGSSAYVYALAALSACADAARPAHPAARKDTLRRCADAIRAVIPCPRVAS